MSNESSLAIHSRGSLRRRPSSWRYVWRVLTHPCNVVLLAIAGVVAAVTASSSVIAAAVWFQVGLMWIAPRSRVFRRLAGSEARQLDAWERLHRREQRMMCASPQRRGELEQLGLLVNEIERSDPVAHSLDLHAVLDAYAAAAIACHSYEQAMESVSRDRLVTDLANLRMDEHLAADEIRCQHVEILARRVAHWDMCAARARGLRERLDMVADFVRLAAQRARVAGLDELAPSELDERLAAIAATDSAMSELSAA
jgi:hypothetical protein